MVYRAYRYLPIVLLGFLLQTLLPNAATAGGRSGPATETGAQLPARATCAPCQTAAKNCAAGCVGLSKKEAVGCLVGCENAAEICSCDQAVTLRSEDVVSFQWPSLNKAACNTATTCPGYTSCASWSSYAECGDPYCGFGLNCGEDCGECPEFGPCHCPGDATRKRRESFRVCFNSSGQSCTEWQLTSFIVACGC